MAQLADAARTQWFNAQAQPPVRGGRYEAKCPIDRRIKAAEWDGARMWIVGKDMGGPACSKCQWRGLAEKPQ